MAPKARTARTTRSRALAGVILAAAPSAAASRSLLAHKPNGGSSLHELAFYTSVFSTTNPLSNNQANSVTGLPTATYFTSNGNGTWSPQTNAALASPSASVTTPFNPAYSQTGVIPFSVDFPSMSLGIAANSAGGMPLFLTTVDGATTWQPVTGYNMTALQGFFAVATVPVLPAMYSVYCTSRNLCLSAGGYGAAYPSTVAATITLSSTWPMFTALGASAATQAGASTTNGVIMRSINGGTFWTSINLPNVPVIGSALAGPVGGLNAVGMDASGRHVFAVGAPAVATAIPITGPAPNCLLPGAAATCSPTSVAVSANTVAAGTILYSGNSGVSFITQSAPLVVNYYYELNAVAIIKGTVAFAVGGNPFGTPGNVATNANVLSANGIIIGTMNGGFTWAQQTLASYTYSCAAAYTATGAYSNAVAGVAVTTAAPYALTTTGFNPNWCFATTVYTPKGTQTNGEIPYINGIAFYNSPTTGAYMGFAVGNSGLVYTTVITKASIVTSAYAAPTSWTVYGPANSAFANTVYQSSGFLNLWGITWDNVKVGYIWGQGVILSTHDGGNTWASETPNIVIGMSPQPNIWSIATVPTSF